MKFNNITLRLAIDLALRKRGPRQIYADEKNNFVIFYAQPPEAKARPYLIDRYGENDDVIVTIVRQYEGEQPSQACVKIPRLTDFKFDVKYFYGTSLFSYDSLFVFIIVYLSRFNWMLTFKERALQRKFNRTAPNLKKEKQVIQKMIEFRLNFSNEKMSSVGENGAVGTSEIMKGLYGRRVYKHPDYRRLHEQTLMILEGLTQRGDIIKIKSGKYLATGKAINTLSEIETTEIRHKDQIGMSRWMVILTVIIAIIMAAQIPIIRRVLQLE